MSARLLEAIVTANHSALPGATQPSLRVAEFAGALPVVGLTCIDPRLNRLIPDVLGLPEEQFIWLRNAGNIITSPLSSTMRSLALACAIKGGREILVLGHTDCLVGKINMLTLLGTLADLGVDRRQLPENLNEYFGLFASERQNVIRGVDIIRRSPLIGSKVPVHGLLLDLGTGRLEWLVNGYTPSASAPDSTGDGPSRPSLVRAARDLLGSFAPFELGEMKSPVSKIGEIVPGPQPVADPGEGIQPALRPPEPAAPGLRAAVDFERLFDQGRRYRVLGSDQKVYGPIAGRQILEWITEGRVSWETPAQVEGSGEWRPLATWTAAAQPPPLSGSAMSRSVPAKGAKPGWRKS
jgi:carbonic anhydrase